MQTRPDRARSVQRKPVPGLFMVPSPVQRKENTGSWIFQQPQRPVNHQPIIQPKVKVHPSDDHFEKEADQVADKVIAGGKVNTPAKVSRTFTASAQRRKSNASKNKNSTRPVLQTKTAGPSLRSSDSSPPAASSSSSHPLETALSNQQTRGSPLPASTRNTMESRMGADFSGVRIHTGSESHTANSSVGARAFTNGPHIHFAEGQYNPHTRSGQHLLAHELTHTVQQGAAPAAGGTASLQRSLAATPERGPPAAAGEIQFSLLDSAISRIGELLNDLPSITEGLDGAKRWLMGKLRQFASFIPGYTAVGVVLGRDPITGERIERNGRNFINAALDIIPGGALLKQKLEELGAIDRAAAWIDAQIETLGGIISGVRDEFLTAWNDLGITSILDGPLNIVRNFGDIFLRAINNLLDFAGRAAAELLAIVKEFLLTQLVNFIRNHTNAYELLKVIIGKDPITDEAVERNGTNILNALLELGGEQGREQRRQMQETGTFQKAADWIDRGIAVFGNLYQTIRDNFGLIWNVVSIDSLMDPVGTFNRIYETFAAPVRDVLQFVADTLIVILRFIKEALMQRLSAWARTVRGYPLVTVLIGKDPFTDEVVPRSIPNIIRGFMSLMEGGEEQYRQMEQSGAIARTTQRINAAVERLNMTPAYIVQLFTDLWNSFSFADLTNPIAAFRRILDRFGEPIGRLLAFVVEIVKIVVEVLLQVMNFPIDLIRNIISRAMSAFERIKRNPVAFLRNLLRAVKQGFVQFFNNILTHLLNGLTGWLMSELRDANVPAPTDFSLRGIISWILQVLGISMEAIWQKLAAHPRIGPERVARLRGMIDRLEGIWTFIRDVQQRGIAAIWDKIQEQLSNLWNTVLDAIKNWVMERIITQVTARLLSMLDPTGIMAVVNSAIAIYRAVQSFIRYLRQMLEVVNSFVNGVAEIAEGNITVAANYLERTMGRAMPIVIGFLANQVGLSGIGRRIGEMVTRVREMVDRALTWLVNRAVNTGFAVFDRLLAMGRSAVGAVRGLFSRLLGIRRPFTMGGQSHNIFFRQSGNGVELMMASEPQTVRTFLRNQETVNASNPAQLAVVRNAQRQVGVVERVYQNIVRIQQRGPANPRDATGDEYQDAPPSEYATLNNEIGSLVTLLTSLGTALAPTGKVNNPLDAIPMVWRKPPANYAPVSLPVTGQVININQPQDIEIPRGRGLADVSREGFSERTIRIGVPQSSVFWPAVGKIWPRIQVGAIRGGTVQGQFRTLLDRLGYVWGSNQADHVRDLQWGGEDNYPNIWPLPAALNNAANQILTQNVTYQNDAGAIVTVPLNTTPLNRYFRIADIQPKLKQTGITDLYEKEADSIADRVVSNHPYRSPVTISRVASGIQRKPKQEKKPAEKKLPLPPAPVPVEKAISKQDTRGSPLPAATKATMENKIGADFSNVRVHTGAQSQQAAASMGARAFTTGNHIHFGSGEFNPQTKTGQHLLAHELVHTVQQGASPQKSVVKKTSTAPVAKKEKKDAGKKAADKKEKAKKKAKGKKGGKQRSEAEAAAAGTKGKKKSPSSPEEDPAYQQTIKKANANAKQQQSHAPYKQKADDAQAAAKAVPNEAESKAQDRKTAGMGEAGKQDIPFDAASFKAALLAKVEEITPKTLEEADDFKEKNKISDVKKEVSGKVGEAKQNTTGPVAKATGTPLQVNAAENKQPVDLPPTETGAKPPPIGAKNAVPKPKTEDEISMQEQSASLDEEMKQNNITETQLEGSNEPSFQAAVKEKRSAQKDALDKPKEYQKNESAELKAAQAEATGKAAGSMTAMFTARDKNFNGVVTQQADTKKKDEDKRAQVAKDINDKYLAAEKKVNEALQQAETLSNAMFDSGAETARQQFEDYVDNKMSAYKSRRYSGLLGGAAWLKDKLFGMPDEVNVFYTEGRDLYLKKMDEVITRVAEVVTEKLNAAKTAITEGKKEIDDYVSKLPEGLEAVGKEAADIIKDKFESLEQTVNDKRQQLIDGFARKYVDNLKKLDDRITALKEANKGLVQKVIGMLKEVWKVIKNLYQLFKTILSKLAQIIGVIIGAPGKFFSNLGAAFSRGFDMFKSRLDEHLENGLMIWLSTQLGVAGLVLPPKFDTAAIFSMALQVMGISYVHIRERAVIKIGEERVAMMETTAGIFQRIYKEGLGAIWEMIKEKFTDFKEMLWDAIKSFIRDAVIKAALVFLLSLLNPVAAFVKACMAIYDFLMMLVRMKDRIIDLLNSILDAVMTIAHGSVDAAAAAIEKAFAKSIPIIIGFLAALLRLNNIGARVRDMILRIRARIDKIIDWLIDKAYKLVGPAVEAGMRLKKKGTELVEKGKEKVAGAGKKILGWLGLRKEFADAAGEHHEIYFTGKEKDAKLYVASQNPRTVNGLLDTLRPNMNKAANKKFLPEFNHAVAINSRVNELKENLKKDNHPGAQADSEELNEKMGKLAVPLAVLMPLTGSAEPPPLLKPSFSDGVKAHSFEVHYLKAGRLAGGSPAGANSGASLPGWSAITLAGLSKASKWVKMHLFTEQLGGPALDSNLTPALGQEVNLEFYKKLEKGAIEAVGAGQVIWFQSTIRYHGAPNADYANFIKMEYGPYEYVAAAGKWEKRASGTTVNNEVVGTKFEKAPDPPDFSGAQTIPNLNNVLVGRVQIENMAKGLDRSFAEFVVNVRYAVNKFLSPSDIRKQLKDYHDDRKIVINRFDEKLNAFIAAYGTAYTL